MPALAAAASLCLALPGVALALTGPYKGKSPQGNRCGKNFKSPCTIELKVVSASIKEPPSHIRWHASCRTKNSLTGDTGIHGPLRNGKFHAHGTYRASGLGTMNGKPVSARETVTISITVGTRKATGSLSATAVVFAGTQRIDHCSSGKINFTARR
jgi:hypothetical protein